MLQDFDGMLFHTHAAENRAEVEAVRRRCSMDNIEYFSSCGLLGPNTCLAHCIWLQEHELDLLARSGSKVLHCPSSNLKLGSGIARVPEMLSRGINVSLGADGAPCNNTLDVFQEMRLAALIQKPHHGPSAMRAEAVFEMATCGGAEALGLAGEVGSIEVNKRADIVFLDLGRTWNPITTAESQNVYSSIVYSCSPENVRATMVDGSWLYKEGRYVTLDETAVVAHASEELMKLLNRM
jgi:cytosine/adenosine deaminase-related metal-dependent hydrolase